MTRTPLPLSTAKNWAFPGAEGIATVTEFWDKVLLNSMCKFVPLFSHTLQ
jgi:hypothetical protein